MAEEEKKPRSKPRWQASYRASAKFTDEELEDLKRRAESAGSFSKLFEALYEKSVLNGDADSTMSQSAAPSSAAGGFNDSRIIESIFKARDEILDALDDGLAEIEIPSPAPAPAPAASSPAVPDSRFNGASVIAELSATRREILTALLELHRAQKETRGAVSSLPEQVAQQARTASVSISPDERQPIPAPVLSELARTEDLSAVRKDILAAIAAAREEEIARLDKLINAVGRVESTVREIQSEPLPPSEPIRTVPVVPPAQVPVDSRWIPLAAPSAQPRGAATPSVTSPEAASAAVPTPAPAPSIPVAAAPADVYYAAGIDTASPVPSPDAAPSSSVSVSEFVEAVCAEDAPEGEDTFVAPMTADEIAVIDDDTLAGLELLLD